jgi:eukaryotic-like serine/threonine-protein kinase
MSADPADRTATLQPTLPSDAAPLRSRDDEDSLPVDDPDRYQQVSEHARGGLGRIVRAVDRRLGRTVAVKELLRQDQWHEARFMREALITARLEHPGIVPVHEAGRWPNGAPYYVMKLVEGRTLKELFVAKQTLRDRLGLLEHVIAIADAVGYAHSEGVIHRDLKPSNVIVGEFGETIVVDWGLARDTRRTDIPEPAAELLVTAQGSGVSTISGKVVGTPAYMAPEQARGEIVDERADVYAIGAVLYELLAGKAPHADITPQAVLDRVIAGPPAPLAQVADDAPDELADIVAKAMARVPADRYVNATALAEDLRRYQTGKLVSAHTYTAWQLVRKKLAQHRGVVVVAIASAIALAGVGVESFRSVVAERDIARVERERAEDARSNAEERKRELVLVQAETSLRKDPTAALAWLKIHPVTDTDRTHVVDVMDEALALGAARHVFRPGDWVFDVAFAPDGKTLFAAVRDGKLRAYDVASGKVSDLGKGMGPIEAVAVSPDGSTLVTGGGLGDVIAWPLRDGGAKKVLAERGRPVTGVTFHPDGKRVVIDRDGVAEILALDGVVTKLGPESIVRSAVASADWSRRIGKIAPNQVAVLGETGTRLVAQTSNSIGFIAISPKGDTVLVQDSEGVWTVPFAGGPLTKLASYEAKLNEIVWSPDGKQAALIGHSHDVPIVDLATRKINELRGHTDAIYNAEFSRDGTMLLTAGDDGTARVWNIADGSAVVLRGHDDDVYRARFSPDEQTVATSSLDGSVRVWPLDRSGARVLSEGGEVYDMTVEGDRAIVVTKTGVARWDLAAGKREPLFAKQGLGIGVPSPNGELLATPALGWNLELRRRTGPSLMLRGHKDFITHLEWSRDNHVLYSGSLDGTLRKWDLKTGTSTLLVEGDVPVRGFAVSADGRVAAQVGETAIMIKADGTAETMGNGPGWCGAWAMFERVRDRLLVQRCDRGLLLVDGKQAINLPTEGYPATRVTVSPDGERIAGAMGDRTVRVWDSQGRSVVVLRGHTDLVMDVAFSPDGAQLASVSYDKTIRIWELATGRHRVLRGHAHAVDRVMWRSAQEVVTASFDGTIRIWPVPETTPPTQAQIAARLATATSAVIDSNNRATSSGS